MLERALDSVLASADCPAPAGSTASAWPLDVAQVLENLRAGAVFFFFFMGRERCLDVQPTSGNRLLKEPTASENQVMFRSPLLCRTFAVAGRLEVHDDKVTNPGFQVITMVVTDPLLQLPGLIY